MEPVVVTPEGESEELALLYQVSVADLAYFKQQQWSVANYSLLLYAGICGATKLIALPIRLSETLVLGALVCATAVAASVVLWKLEAAIEIRRERLRSAREQLSDAFFRAWGSRGKLEERVSVCWLLQGALVVGAGVALWVLHRQ